MKALDRKLLRDLRLRWSPVLSIALVVASGVGGFLTTLSAVESLALAGDRVFASGRPIDIASVSFCTSVQVDQTVVSVGPYMFHSCFTFPSSP